MKSQTRPLPRFEEVRRIWTPNFIVRQLIREESRKKDARPVIDLLKLLQDLDTLYSGLAPGRDLSRTLRRKVDASVHKVNKILAVHGWLPGIVAGENYVEEFPQYRGRQYDVRAWTSQMPPTAMWLLLARMRSGEIQRFRKCDDCGLWFYAKREHQRFCKDSCRKKYASKSAEYRTKRKLYMRGYRRQEKQRDKQAMAQLKLKRR
jgi:hypothetical protein